MLMQALFLLWLILMVRDMNKLVCVTCPALLLPSSHPVFSGSLLKTHMLPLFTDMKITHCTVKKDSCPLNFANIELHTKTHTKSHALMKIVHTVVADS